MYGPSPYSAFPVSENMALCAQLRGSDLPRACSGVDHNSSTDTGNPSEVSG